MEILKLLNSNEIVVQVLNFLILFFLMKKFFWKPLLKLLDERKAGMVSDFETMEKNKKDMEELKVTYEKKLNAIEDIAHSKLQEAVHEGKLVAAEINKKAHLEAQRIMESAKNDIQYEIVKAKEELKEKIIDLTITATENVIRERLSEEDDKKIIETFLNDLDKAV